VPLTDIDLGDWSFWVQDDDLRDGAFATLRREAPVSFHPALETPGVQEGPGHWAVTRYDDVWFASRHPHIFSSHPSITINDANPDVSEYFGSMIVMDDPKHLSVSYNLTCHGTASPAAGFGSTPAAPGPISFPPTAVGDAYTATITIFETGDAPLNVSRYL